jgi:hypothetical protein
MDTDPTMNQNKDTNKRSQFNRDFYLVVAAAIVFLVAMAAYNALIIIFERIFGQDVFNTVDFQIFFVIFITVIVVTTLYVRAYFINII